MYLSAMTYDGSISDILALSYYVSVVLSVYLHCYNVLTFSMLSHFGYVVSYFIMITFLSLSIRETNNSLDVMAN